MTIEVNGTVIICEDDLDLGWWASSLPPDRLLDPIAEALESDHHTPAELTISINKKLGNLARVIEADFTTSKFTILINREERTVAVGDDKELRIVSWDSFLKTRMEKSRLCAN